MDYYVKINDDKRTYSICENDTVGELLGGEEGSIAWLNTKCKLIRGKRYGTITFLGTAGMCAVWTWTKLEDLKQNDVVFTCLKTTLRSRIGTGEKND